MSVPVQLPAVQGGSPAAGKATDICGSVPTPFPGLTACTETMKALSGPRLRSPCRVSSTGTGSLLDLGTRQEGGRPNASDPSGQRQRTREAASFQLKLNHLPKSKVRKEGSHSPRPRQGERQLSPGPAVVTSPDTGLPAPLAGPVPLCGDRFSKEGLTRGDRGTKIQTSSATCPKGQRSEAQDAGLPLSCPAFRTKFPLQSSSL